MRRSVRGGLESATVVRAAQPEPRRMWCLESTIAWDWGGGGAEVRQGREAEKPNRAQYARSITVFTTLFRRSCCPSSCLRPMTYTRRRSVQFLG